MRSPRRAHSRYAVLSLVRYIGEYECGALIKEMHKKKLPRPGTHDLMKNMLDVMGYRVTQVRVTALVGNIYHARVYMVGAEKKTEAEKAGADADSGEGSESAVREVTVDSRPSDAINMAVRYDAPIYVNKEVALKMGHPAGTPGMSGLSGST